MRRVKHSNTVHTYVMGAKFDTIFGGKAEALHGTITHIEYMSPLMKQKWPWIKGMWELSNNRGYSEWYKTLKAAKKRAQEMWEGCFFKTPKEF